MSADALGALAEPVAPGPEPPERGLSPREWVRANLFPTPFNGVLTVVIGALTGWLLFRLARWVFVTAEWAIVRVNLRLFMVWRFPTDQLWRVWVSLYVLAAVVGVAVGLAAASAARRAVESGAEPEAEHADDRRPRGPVAAATTSVRRFWPALLAVAVILSFTRTLLPSVLTVGAIAMLVLAQAGGRRLPAGASRWAWLGVVAGVIVALQVITFGPSGVGWDDWGGLQLTVAATVAGIALAFPIGLLLALGRRSSLPGIRVVSTAYIEAFRAVPLVALLFVGQYMIGFLFPTSIDPPSFLVRAVIAITLFEAAYIAEIVRGGLQAVPRGQVEAAQAIGLPPTKVLRMIVLPQALRAVIPAMVGQFISLFKDTSLLAIISLIELLGVVERVSAQSAFRGQGVQIVAYVFVGFVYWAGCSTMARESRRLEHRLGVGER